MARRRWVAVAGVVVVLASACGRGSSADKTSAPVTPAATTQTSTAGDFGSLKAICGPGNASGATARGVTDTEIDIATLADPSNTIIPGAGQETFDISDGFVKWCNAAGGILGRKIVLTKYDSALFNVAAKVIDACQNSFMLVANANPLDAAGVKPRLACNMAQIPAYATSSQAAEAGQQVVIDSSIHQVSAGSWRVLAKQFPAAFQALSLITVDGAGLDSFAERQRDALTTLGDKVVDFQKTPVTGVSNWRPYIERARLSGAKAAITLSPDISALVRSFDDVGWKPDVLPLGVQNYNAGTIELAKSGVLPPTYVSTTYVPFEAADTSPATQQAVALIKASSHLTPDFAHLQALDAWLLWASAAKACGSQLTGACVIAKAGNEKGWTGGGIIAPVDTHVGPGVLSDCFVLVKATATGFVLAPEITKPNKGIFNCDPANVVAVTNTHTGG
ncbi:MAG: ABC-type branched-chain amino acid transport system periplasmic component-like protein [Mycobacterium sp.]|jgi:ABC-type branched-subunit amino acid transport system substrate-binding protein|nr:ABC-type branched-chain amino acid transport system periplasmic component-like protein [Mycobacterium sp.]